MRSRGSGYRSTSHRRRSRRNQFRSETQPRCRRQSFDVAIALLPVVGQAEDGPVRGGLAPLARSRIEVPDDAPGCRPRDHRPRTRVAVSSVPPAGAESLAGEPGSLRVIQRSGTWVGRSQAKPARCSLWVAWIEAGGSDLPPWLMADPLPTARGRAAAANRSRVAAIRALRTPVMPRSTALPVTGFRLAAEHLSYLRLRRRPATGSGSTSLQVRSNGLRASRYQSWYHGTPLGPPGRARGPETRFPSRLRDIGETGFEPATARPPAGEHDCHMRPDASHASLLSRDGTHRTYRTMRPVPKLVPRPSFSRGEPAGARQRLTNGHRRDSRAGSPRGLSPSPADR